MTWALWLSPLDSPSSAFTVIRSPEDTMTSAPAISPLHRAARTERHACMFNIQLTHIQHCHLMHAHTQLNGNLPQLTLPGVQLSLKWISAWVKRSPMTERSLTHRKNIHHYCNNHGGLNKFKKLCRGKKRKQAQQTASRAKPKHINEGLV